MAPLPHPNDLLKLPDLTYPFYPAKSSSHYHDNKPNLHRRITLVFSKKAKNEEAFKEKKIGVVDYDKGKHNVSVQLSGLRKDDIPKRYRLRVEGDRFQKDWAISEVVEKILKLNHWDNIESVLNCWVGRFARKNFPVLIRESFSGITC